MQTEITNRTGQRVGVTTPIEFTVHTLSPITTAQRVKIQGGSILIQNAGDEVATINRDFDIQVGQTLSLATNDDYNYFSQEIHISFDGTGINPMVQILEARATIKGYGTLIQR